MKNHIAVLIVGAGPTGLTLANELARRSINFRIIERSASAQTGSRAKGLQARSLEIFDDIGIADEILEAGNSSTVFRQFDGPTMISENVIKKFHRDDAKYSSGTMLPQWKVEEILRKKLAEFNTEVEFNTELLDFTQEDNIIKAQIKKGAQVEELTCNYMVACSGGKSNIRKNLGINFIGETHETERALVGDVEVEGLVPDAWHIWVDKTYGIGVALCPFKCTDSWQYQAVMMPDENGNMPEANLQNFQKVFDQRARMENVKLKNCTWQSEYRVNVRMADKYHVGDVFIAGDAAHVHSIAGGLGMNTGIQDAYNLGWKLAAVVNGANPELLDTYEEERQPIAAWTLNISSERQDAMLKELSKGKDMAGTGTKDTTQLDLNYRYSSLSINDHSEENKLQAGDRAPEAELQNGSRLTDLYRGTHFTIIASNGVELGDLQPQFSSNVKVLNLSVEELTKAGYAVNTICIIRPDGYIGAIVKHKSEAINYLKKFI